VDVGGGGLPCFDFSPDFFHNSLACQLTRQALKSRQKYKEHQDPRQKLIASDFKSRRVAGVVYPVLILVLIFSTTQLHPT
jgi:hypothetical protein